MPTQLKWFISFIIAGVVIVVFLNRYMPERVDTIYVNCRIYTRWMQTAPLQKQCLTLRMGGDATSPQ